MSSDTLTLDDLEGGAEAVISGIDGRGKRLRKLLYMGLYPGATVKVIRRGMAGNPLEVILDDSIRIAIRRKDARMVKVEKRQ